MGLAQTDGTAKYGTPQSYTPKHLAEKILTSKAALEGERKQVTVLFADLKGSMELLADRDPEEARKLLDPVLEHMMEAVHRYEGTARRQLHVSSALTRPFCYRAGVVASRSLLPIWQTQGGHHGKDGQR
jgi:class 3 adenylate cyclase